MAPGSTTIDRQRRPRETAWPEIISGIVTSFLLHGLILAIAILSLLWPEKEPEPEYDLVFEEVELLALGQPRDPNELPRLAASQAPPEDDGPVVEVDQEPPPAEPAPAVDPEPEPEVDTVELRRRQEREEQERREAEAERRRQERERRMAEALGGITSDGAGSDAPEGSEHGVAGGTVTDEALADMMQTFQARVLQEIQRYWEVPVTLSSSDLTELAGKVRVQVRLAQSGHIVSYRLLTRSGNDQFDTSIERVLQRFERQRGGRALPMPERADIRDQILREGLILTNWQLLEP